MTWVRIDDGMPDHPKFSEPEDEDEALALWVRSLCYCNRNRTDGFVPRRKVATLSRAADPYVVASQLVAAGLWEEVDGGFVLHDYADYQPLKAQIEARSAMKAAVGQLGGKASGEVRRNQNGTNLKPNAKQPASKKRSSDEAKLNPTPTPDPTPGGEIFFAREEQGGCQDERQGHGDDRNHGDAGSSWREPERLSAKGDCKSPVDGLSELHDDAADGEGAGTGGRVDGARPGQHGGLDGRGGRAPGTNSSASEPRGEVTHGHAEDYNQSGNVDGRGGDARRGVEVGGGIERGTAPAELRERSGSGDPAHIHDGGDAGRWRRSGGDAGGPREPAPLTPGPPSRLTPDPEGLLDVLARLVAEGSEWAAGVERWRQDNPGRALTEPQRKRLREIRDKDATGPRQRLSTADEADVQAIVEAYVAGQRRIIRDAKFVALATHYSDAKAILDDARRLVERAATKIWRPSPAEVVAHRLETYLRDTRNGPAFRLRWIFDRTEQDDLPRPPARAAPKEAVQEGPIGARRGPVLKPMPPPPDVAAKVAEFTKSRGGDEKSNRSG